MSLQIKGSLYVARYAEVDGKNIARSVNETDFDSSGNVKIDTFRTDYYNKILSALPLSHFTPINITGSGFVVNFNSTNTVLLSGKEFDLDQDSINLSTIKTNPSNSTFYVYITMVQGLAKYLISDSVIAESGTSAYNIFWVGTVLTNASAISNINIITRSRLDVFSPSATAAGSSFPVSTGFPSSTGSISW